jgi:uncharacterized protein YndB with AHSA1/START domain
MALYHFTTEMRFGATPERVWQVLEDATSWPAWWRWLRRAEVLAPGGGDRVGRRYRFEFRTALGYTLVFESEVVRSVPPFLWESRATGELAGRGVWEVAAVDGGSMVHYTWIVATAKRWMNVVAPVARPAFNWNHHVIMRDFARGLAGRLDAPLVMVANRAIRPGTPGFGQLPRPIQP